MRGKFLYLCLILFTAYVEIMYENSRALMFLGFELLMGLAMLLLALYLKFHVSIRLSVNSARLSKGEPLKAGAAVINRGFLPAAGITALLVLENRYGEPVQEIPIRCEADAKKEARPQYLLPALYCGKYTLWLEKERISDYLGLFGLRLGGENQMKVQVLPGLHQIPVEIGERTRRFPVEGEEYDPHRSGDDPSEIFQIREYRPGDGIQRIHWKMSAKAGQWMTKEYGLGVGCSVLLLLDLHGAGGRIEGERLDRILETAVSISYSLVLAGCMHYTAWYEADAGAVRRLCIQGEEDVFGLQEEILEADPFGEACDLEEVYRFRFPEGRYATVLRLDANLLLWRNGELCADLSEAGWKDLEESWMLQV